MSGGYEQPPFGQSVPQVADQQPGPPEIEDAVGWAWRRLWANAGPFLLMGLLALIPFGLLAGFGVSTAMSDPRSVGAGTGGTVLAIVMRGPGYAIGTLVVMAWSLLVGAFMWRGALKATVSPKVTLADFFDTTNLGRYLVAAIVLQVANYVLGMIPFAGTIAGIVLVALAMFFVEPLVLDQAMPLGQAIQTSWRTVFSGRNIGGLLLLGFIFGLIVIAGFLALVIGLIAVMPLSSLGMAYTYKRTLGLPVIPAPKAA